MKKILVANRGEIALRVTRSALVFSLICIALHFTSCRRAKFVRLSDEDAQETMANDISGESGGAVMEIKAVLRASAVLNNSIFCGLTGDTSFTEVGGTGNLNFTATCTWLVNCTSSTPSSISFENMGSASYDGSTVDFSSTFVGEAVVTGLDGSSTDYIVTGTSVRTGTGTTEVKGRTKSFTYVNTITYNNVVLNKSDYEIQSGTAYANLVGTAVDGDDFDRGATFVFNANNGCNGYLDNQEQFSFNLR